MCEVTLRRSKRMGKRVSGRSSYKCNVCLKTFSKRHNLNEHSTIHTGAKLFTCGDCNMTFRLKKYLINHISTHTGIYKFNCETCGKSTNDKCRFKEHLETHIGEIKYLCEMCPKKFTSYRSFTLHLQTIHSIKSEDDEDNNNNNMEKVDNENMNLQETNETKELTTCKICFRSFETEASLRIHMRHHEDKKPHLCPFCNKSFKLKKLFVEHMKCHRKETFKCSKCPLVFLKNGNLKKHLKNHSKSIQKLKCSVCPKTFKRKCNLVVHERTHSGLKLYSCHYCGFKFSQVGGLKRHLTKFTGNGPYNCTSCSSSFETACLLKAHGDIHDEVKQHLAECNNDVGVAETTHNDNLTNASTLNSKKKVYKCKHCGKILLSKFTFKMHLENHMEGTKKFACDACDKSFSWKNHLDTHKLIHTGERPFACSECPKAFRRMNSLKNHLLLHQGIKAFQCTTCGRRFSKCSILRNHERTHTGEKLYQCQYCSTKFSQIASINRHLKNYTGNDPYLCSFCPAHFEAGCLLHDHMAVHEPLLSSYKRRKSQKKKQSGVDSEKSLGGEANLYSCSHCDNKFLLRSSFKQHMRHHMKREPFVCCRCLKRFSRSADLLKHNCLKSSEFEKTFWDTIHTWSSSFENQKPSITNEDTKIEEIEVKFEDL